MSWTTLLASALLFACAQPCWAIDLIPPPPGVYNANLQVAPPSHPMNSATGETLVPVGRNYVGARSGTLYVPAGPKGVIDPRSGRFMPMQ